MAAPDRKNFFRLLTSLVESQIHHISGLRTGEERPRRAPPGSSPGIEHAADVDTPPDSGTVTIDVHDYGADDVEAYTVEGDLPEFFARPRPDWCVVRWINIDGLHPYTINQFREHFQFHTLAAEDVLHVTQRPKMEPYDEHLFIVARMLLLNDGKLHDEQTSLFFFNDTVITFQETHGDVWDPVRKRMEVKDSRLRTKGAGYLLYALLDAMVDHFFPILESYGDLLEEMENVVLEYPTARTQQRIHAIKRELSLLRRVMWPMREMVDAIYREETGIVPDSVKDYLRDVYDHTVQVIDVIETYREMAAGLNDLYMSAVSNRMNEIMKVLTIMASFFIPITFIAGVYGMNFEHIPELAWPYAYAVFWVVCLSVIAALAYYFRRKGWIGGAEIE